MLALLAGACGGPRPKTVSVSPSITTATTSATTTSTTTGAATAPSDATTPVGSRPAPAGPPSPGAVAAGRYVHPVEVTGLHVSPSPSGSTLGLTWKQADAMFEATSAVAGSHQYAILGFGTVTLAGRRLPRGVPAFDHRPAWVGIVWGGIVSCPAQTVPAQGASTTVPAPFEPVFTAVVIYGVGGSGAVVYTGRGSPPCGGALQGPTVARAYEIRSVPWRQEGRSRAGSLLLGYFAAGCATLWSTGGTGNVKTDQLTVTVEVSVPFDRAGCAAPVWRRTIDSYAPREAPPGLKTLRDPTLHHGPIGLVRALQVN
jgi:hypothetical protein